MADPFSSHTASDDVQDILGTPPSWILRRGAGVAVLAVLLLLLAGWLVRIPESLQASATLQLNNAPVRVRLPQSVGQFTVFVNAGDSVQAESWLVARRTAANPLHVWKVRQVLTPMQTMSGVEVEQVELPENQRLGRLQEPYERFRLSLQEFNQVLRQGYDRQAAASVDEQMELVQSSIQILEEKLQREQRVLNVRRQELVQAQKLIREKEITYDAYSNKLEAKNEAGDEVRDIELDLQREQQELERLKRMKLSVRQQAVDGNYDRLLTLRRDLRQLLDALNRWEAENITAAPIAGQVQLKGDYVPGQLYRNEFQEILSIIPFGKRAEQFTALLRLRGERAGKVEPGQEVLIQLDGYPVSEYGFLRGTVQDRPYYAAEGDSFLSVDVVLDKKLVTTKGRELPYDFTMQGQAEIVIENERFLYQLFQGFVGLF